MAQIETRARAMAKELVRGDPIRGGFPANPDGAAAVEIIEELLFILKTKKRVDTLKTTA